MKGTYVACGPADVMKEIVVWLTEYGRALSAATIIAIKLAQSVDCSTAGVAMIVDADSHPIPVDLVHVIYSKVWEKAHEVKRRVWGLEAVSTP